MSGHELVIDFCGRPLLANASHRMHPQEASRARRVWRDAACRLAQVRRIPHYEQITVTTWAEYPSRRSLPDCDGIAPSVKGAIDGLVLAGVITDDGPRFVRSITYLAPVVKPGATPALVVRVDEVQP